MNEIVPLGLAVIVILGFRARRMMTEQVYRSYTIWARVVLLTALGLFVLLLEMRSRLSLLGVAGGFLLGVVLGGYSLSRTQFWPDADPPRYKTNPYIGLAVVALFAIRVLYDALQAHARLGHAGAVDPLAVSWLAALLYFLFVAYWEVYYIGLISRFRHGSGSRPASS
jgi:hypothetical protein